MYKEMDLQEVGGSCGDWMELAQDRDMWRALVGTVRNLRVPKIRGISWLAAEQVSLSRRTLLHGVGKYRYATKIAYIRLSRQVFVSLIFTYYSSSKCVISTFLNGKLRTVTRHTDLNKRSPLRLVHSVCHVEVVSVRPWRDTNRYRYNAFVGKCIDYRNSTSVVTSFK